MTPWTDRLLTTPDWTLEQQRAHTTERKAIVVRILIAVVAVPVVWFAYPNQAVVLTCIALGVVVVSLFSGAIAERFPQSAMAANLAWPLTLAATTAAVALTGGFYSALFPMMVLPGMGAAARFRGVVAVAAIGLTMASAATIAVLTVDGGAWPAILTVVSLGLVGYGLWLFGAQNVKAHEDAILDPLTQLFNRAHLQGRLTELEITMARAGGEVGMVVADLDRFKQINDEYGHARGDAVLRDVAYMMRENIRVTDVAFRAGGEEFVLVLPGADTKTANSIAERVRGAVEHGRPGDLKVTLSCGVVSARASDGINMESILARADAALYEAKRGGRNKVRSAPEPIRSNGGSALSAA